MPLRSTSDEELPGINLTPMIDIMLTLLIFFLVATKMYDWEHPIAVSVPVVERSGSAAKPVGETVGELVINIARGGSISLQSSLGQQDVSLAELGQRLKERVARFPDQPVLVRGDGLSLYQRVADVIAACQAAGIQHLAVSVKEK